MLAVICIHDSLLEGCTREGSGNNIVASPVWKHDTGKCVDASPLVVSDG